KLFSLQIAGKGRMNFCLEEDMGTIRTQKKHVKSVAGYLAWRQEFIFSTKGENSFGIKSFRVLHMSPTVKQADRLREMIRLSFPTPNRFLLFSSHDLWNLDDPLRLLRGDIWRTAYDEDEPIRLVE